MDTAFPQKFPFILDRNLAKAKCTGNQICTSCDTVVLGHISKIDVKKFMKERVKFLQVFHETKHILVKAPM